MCSDRSSCYTIWYDCPDAKSGTVLAKNWVGNKKIPLSNFPGDWHHHWARALPSIHGIVASLFVRTSSHCVSRIALGWNHWARVLLIKRGVVIANGAISCSRFWLFGLPGFSPVFILWFPGFCVFLLSLLLGLLPLLSCLVKWYFLFLYIYI